MTKKWRIAAVAVSLSVLLWFGSWASCRESLGWTCAQCGATRGQTRLTLAGVTLRDSFGEASEGQRTAYEAITGEPHPEHAWARCGGYSKRGPAGMIGCGVSGDERIAERVGLAFAAARASEPEAKRRRFLAALACPLDDGPSFEGLAELASRAAWSELDQASWIAPVVSSSGS